jgi:peptidylprolyl isomerase
MKRSLLAATALAAVVAIAGCTSSETPSTTTIAGAPTSSPATGSAAAGSGTAVDGIPALGGNPTDTTAAPVIEPGSGQPPAQLRTQDVVVGKGAAATPDDTVDVRYSGSLYDGTAFDSSWQRGSDPISFSLAEVVPGFAQGIVGMMPGGRRVIVIPPALGYGATTKGPIPGGSTLVFVVDYVGKA